MARLEWHTDDVIQNMQNDYIDEVLTETSIPHSLFIAEQSENQQQYKERLGFAHVCRHKDEVSGEICALLTLLAVSSTAQGKGVGQLLMQAAETWAKQQGYRLLHLEVFANNKHAQNFYQNLGFQAEMMTMVKPL